jgi:hypothetical protein
MPRHGSRQPALIDPRLPQEGRFSDASEVFTLTHRSGPRVYTSSPDATKTAGPSLRPQVLN